MFNLLSKKLFSLIFSAKPLSVELVILRYAISGLLFLLTGLLLWIDLQAQEFHVDWLFVAVVDGMIFWPTLRFSWQMQVIGGFLFFRTFG
jgi:hypothetical protein